MYLAGVKSDKSSIAERLSAPASSSFKNVALYHAVFIRAPVCLYMCLSGLFVSTDCRHAVGNGFEGRIGTCRSLRISHFCPVLRSVVPLDRSSGSEHRVRRTVHDVTNQTTKQPICRPAAPHTSFWCFRCRLGFTSRDRGRGVRMSVCAENFAHD